MLFYPCNICLLTEFQHNVRSNVVLFKDLYSSFPLFDRVFFKKIKSLTGQNPQEFIRDIKMKRAATLLREHKYSIGEIAYLTGYPNAKYFSTAFKKYYGCTPSSFVEDEISAPSYSDEV